MTDDHFVYKVVDGRAGTDDPALSEIFHLRYQVYINEWGFEKPEDHPGGMERDDYDGHSLHFYAHAHNSDVLIGTARIILASALPFPIERHFDTSAFPAAGRQVSLGEISRLAISKDYRRRAIDRVIFSDGTAKFDELEESLATAPQGGQERRKCEHELIRGFYLMVYRESLRLGLTHWYAVMARGLWVILRRWGIDFQQIGPERDYHGIRAPYVLGIEDFEKKMAKTNSDFARLIQTIGQDMHGDNNED